MKPLEGVTVLALEHAIAAPLCTRHLADQGARVIKVERPGAGDFARGYDERVRGLASHFVWTNRSKESLTLDLKHPDAPQVLARLLARCDVLVQNLAPGASARLGLSYGNLAQQHPRLIVCDISGYGDDPANPGPYRDRKAYDLLIQSESGFVSVTGSPEEPAKASCSIANIAAGMYAYSNVLAALIERGRTGRGKRIDVSMLQAAVSWLVAVLPLLDMDAEPAEVTRNGNAHRRFVPTNVYPTRDGFLYIALGSNAQWQRLVALPRYKTLAARPDWATAEGRYRDRLDIYRMLGAATVTGTLAEVAADFAAIKVPHTEINTVAAAAALEAIRRRLNQTTLPDGRVVRLPPSAVDLPTLPKSFAPPPRYAEHTRAILAEAGLGAREIDGLFASGAVA